LTVATGGSCMEKIAMILYNVIPLLLLLPPLLFLLWHYPTFALSWVLNFFLFIFPSSFHFFFLAPDSASLLCHWECFAYLTIFSGHAKKSIKLGRLILIFLITIYTFFWYHLMWTIQIGYFILEQNQPEGNMQFSELF